MAESKSRQRSSVGNPRLFWVLRRHPLWGPTSDACPTQGGKLTPLDSALTEEDFGKSFRTTCEKGGEVLASQYAFCKALPFRPRVLYSRTLYLCVERRSCPGSP